MLRGPVDLLELPFSFTQLPAQMPETFRRAARERGVELSIADLEALHRFRILTPFLRFQRDGRLIYRAARDDVIRTRQLAHWHPTSRLDLDDAHEGGRLFDPADESFVARRRLRRRIGDLEYRSSEYLYSHHQLVWLRNIATAKPHLFHSGTDRKPPRLEVDRRWLEWARAYDRDMRELVVVLSALEPVYYPHVVRRLSLGWEAEYERYDKWRRELPLTSITRWLGVDATWLREAAAGLLHRADGFDPLGDWLDVVREGDPERWSKLKGEARLAVDYRIAAEILLRHYEDLARGRRAPRLPKTEGRWRGEFDGRLMPQGGLDQTLMAFGLSPHPRLVLVLEGDTEMHVIPRLMERFGVRRDSDFISVENAEGVDRDLGPLIAYAIAPRTEPETDGRYLRLLRPLTRVLIVTDAEGRMATDVDRERRRAVWIERLMRTLPSEHRTKRVEEALAHLVHVETWDRRGQSFEFAHFTDLELATAVATLDQRPRQPALADRRKHIARIRASRGNLESASGPISKVALAEQLWPVLDAKIARAEKRRTESRIPIVRILDLATDLAREFMRRNMVIPLAKAD